MKSKGGVVWTKDQAIQFANRTGNKSLKDAVMGAVLRQKPASGSEAASGVKTAKKRGKSRREMNATEREFSRMLESNRKSGALISYDYEGLTLRWGEGAGMMTYTPDFVAVRRIHYLDPDFYTEEERKHPLVQLVFFEIKGAHAWQKDIVKFKAARANWPLYEFQLWEKGSDGWAQTI